MQLTQDYGWKLYSYLREQLDDKDAADEAFNRTLTGFYNSLAVKSGDDAVETLLYAFADQTCSQMSAERNVPAHTMMIPESETVPQAATPISSNPAQRKKKSGRFGFVLGVTVLMIGILIAGWVIVGLLMDMGLLPELDLGYSWFNANFAPWF